jgi:hypothetical protein
MPTRYEVTCINKRGAHLSPHERIQYIGNQKQGWRMPEDQAIRDIQNFTRTFYTFVNGKEIDIIVADHKGRKYLKTIRDGYEPDNLLGLPECEDCKTIL